MRAVTVEAKHAEASWKVVPDEPSIEITVAPKAAPMNFPTTVDVIERQEFKACLTAALAVWCSAAVELHRPETIPRSGLLAGHRQVGLPRWDEIQVVSVARVTGLAERLPTIR